MTPAQKYNVATMLAIGDLASVVSRLTALGNVEAIAFAKSIDKHYSKRDGFIPQRVIAICKG